MPIDLKQLKKSRVLEKSRASLVKKGTPGHGADIPYEQAFANIAHEYLRSRVPTLLDYEVGFQLLDRSEDGDKAAGVFGFQAGGRWIFVPVIYDKGEVKGHEVLYIADQDLCVPNDESWVNYILQKEPETLGEPAIGNRRALGIRGPALSLLTRSPLKFASERAKQIANRYPEWVQPFLIKIASLATAGKEDVASWFPTLSEYFEDTDIRYPEAYLKMLQKYPAFKTAAEKLHGQELYTELDRAIEKALDRFHLPWTQGSVLGPVIKRADVRVLRYADAMKTRVPYNLTDGEKKQLVRDGYLIQDRRKDETKSELYRIPEPTKQETVRLKNPSESGIFDLFVRPGKFERTLCIVRPVSHESGSTNSSIVIRISDKDYRIGHGSKYFTNDCPADSSSELKEWYGKLPDVKGFKFSKDNDYLVVLLGPNGSLASTVPFSLEVDLGTQGEDHIYGIWSRCLSDEPKYRAGQAHMPDAYSRFQTSPGQLRVCDDCSTIKAWTDEVMVPPYAKVITLKKPDYSINQNKNDFLPADWRDVTSVLTRGLTRLDVHRAHSSGEEYVIEKGEENKTADPPYRLGSAFPQGKRLSKAAAVAELVERWGLAGETALEVLETATQEKKFSFLIKKGEGNPWVDEGRSETMAVPYDQNTGGNWMANPNTDNDSTMQWKFPVEGLVASQNDPNSWNPLEVPDPSTMYGAMQAAQQGRREAMDTSSVAALLNNNSRDGGISKVQGPLLKAVDALGKEYISFLWNREMMDDRYGISDASNLEDSIRRDFENLGETVMAMHEKNLQAGDFNELLKPQMNLPEEGKFMGGTT